MLYKIGIYLMGIVLILTLGMIFRSCVNENAKVVSTGNTLHLKVSRAVLTYKQNYSTAIVENVAGTSASVKDSSL